MSSTTKDRVKTILLAAHQTGAMNTLPCLPPELRELVLDLAAPTEML